MKLLFCKKCHDVFKLREHVERMCTCGKSGGHYTDGLHAAIWGEAVPIGFDNSSFAAALVHRPESGMGMLFEAFVIPKKCDTVHFVDPAKVDSGGK